VLVSEACRCVETAVSFFTELALNRGHGPSDEVTDSRPGPVLGLSTTNRNASDAALAALKSASSAVVEQGSTCMQFVDSKTSRTEHEITYSLLADSKEGNAKPWNHYCALRIHASAWDCIAAMCQCFRMNREAVLQSVEDFWNPHGYSVAVLSVRRYFCLLYQ
jgi:hypothetical protein